MINNKTFKMQVRNGLDFGTDWYQRANQNVVCLAKSVGVSPADMALALAAFSPRVHVSRSIKMAIEFFENDRQQPAGSMAMVYKTCLVGLENGFLKGPKTENFRRALMLDGSALVLDVWTCRGLRVDPAKAYQKRFLSRIESRFENASQAFGLSTAQVQSCQWVGVMRANNRRDVDFVVSV